MGFCDVLAAVASSIPGVLFHTSILGQGSHLELNDFPKIVHQWQRVC
jgi:hypothetical protein